MNLEEAWQLSLSKKKRQKLKRKTLDYVDIYGPTAHPEIAIKEHIISIKDAQQFIFSLLADSIAPKWIDIKNRPLLNSLVVVVTPGLGLDLYKEIKASNSEFLRFLGEAVVCRATSPKMRPGQLQDVLLIDRRHPNNKGKHFRQQDQRWFNLYPPSHYKLSKEEFDVMDMPSLDKPLPPGFVKTGKGPNDKVHMFALDCEMCVTEKGLELTRITLLNEQGETIMDSLVKPDSDIKDYLYQFSGITPEMMQGCTTRLEDIQKSFLEVVHQQDLLVGHSLDNDLKALKVCHGNIIDTCVLYPHPKGLPYRPALKVLTQKYLKRSIQNGCHDSVQDAKAALDLAKLKIKHGPDWGTAKYWEDCGKTLTEALSAHQVQCLMVDRGSTLNKYAKGNCSAIPVEDDEQALAKFIPQLKEGKFKFNYVQLCDFGKLQDRRSMALENRMKSEIGILSGKVQKLIETNTLADAIAALSHKKLLDKQENPGNQEEFDDEPSTLQNVGSLGNYKVASSIQIQNTQFQSIQQYQFPVHTESLQKNQHDQKDLDNYINLMEQTQEVGQAKEKKKEELDVGFNQNEVGMNNRMARPQDDANVMVSNDQMTRPQDDANVMASHEGYQEIYKEMWQDTIDQRIKELEYQQSQVQGSEMQTVQDALSQRVKELEQQSQNQQIVQLSITEVVQAEQSLEDNIVDMEAEECDEEEKEKCEGDVEMRGFDKVMEGACKKRKLLLGDAVRVTDDLNGNNQKEEIKTGEIPNITNTASESTPKISPAKKWDTNTFKGLQLEGAWKIHSMLRKIDQEAESGSLLLVLTGHGNTGEVRRLSDMKNRCEKLQPLLSKSLEKLEQLGSFDTNYQSEIYKAPQWTEELQDQLDRLLDREILGLCFCKVIA